MTLAEAIHLGSLTLKPWAGTFYKTVPAPTVGYFTLESATHGCALGMAMKAVGKATIVENFPFLVDYVVPPCKHAFQRTFSDAIVHLFDSHVFGLKDWTLDRLIEWVASVEKQLTAKVEQPAQEEEEAAEVLV